MWGRDLATDAIESARRSGPAQPAAKHPKTHRAHKAQVQREGPFHNDDDEEDMGRS
jgi:hypothetical protein